VTKELESSYDETEVQREFRIKAVRLVTDRGVALAQAARDLDGAESVLRRWMRELTATPAAAFPGNGQMRSDLAEIAALKKEVVRLRAGRDILKKAAAFFAREVS
jgi:transposase